MNGSPFSLWKRKENGRYYVRYRLPDGSWSNPKSTGCTKKSDAIDFANDHLQQHGAPLTKRRPTVAEYSLGFFTPGGPWEQDIVSRNGRVRAAHVRNHESRLQNYLIPEFGHRKIDEVTPGDVKRGLLAIKNTATPKRKTRTGKLSAATLNQIRSTLSAIFDAAVADGLVVKNPVRDVHRMSTRDAERRGVLNADADELHRLLDPNTRETVWRSERYYLMFRIALFTAARSAEIRTLAVSDVLDGFLRFRRSQDDVSGVTDDTKNGHAREVPIPGTLETDIRRWARDRVGEALLFPSPEDDTVPIDRDSTLKNFRHALERIGVSRADQKRRVLVYHSLRHGAATLALAAGVDRLAVRTMTGHRSDHVLDGYVDHGELVEWGGLRNWQEGLSSVSK